MLEALIENIPRRGVQSTHPKTRTTLGLNSIFTI